MFSKGIHVGGVLEPRQRDEGICAGEGLAVGVGY